MGITATWQEPTPTGPNDLMEMFRDPAVKGIWCVRGGYGLYAGSCHYWIFGPFGETRKVLIGYSDVTALHLAIYQKTGLTTFHGPVGTSEFTPYTLDQVRKMVMATSNEPVGIPLSEANEEKGQTSDIFRYQVLRPGRVTGRLAGGNLSLVSALAGTPYLPSFKDKIVYLEDIGEKALPSRPHVGAAIAINRYWTGSRNRFGRF